MNTMAVLGAIVLVLFMLLASYLYGYGSRWRDEAKEEDRKATSYRQGWNDATAKHAVDYATITSARANQKEQARRDRTIHAQRQVIKSLKTRLKITQGELKLRAGSLPAPSALSLGNTLPPEQPRSKTTGRRGVI